MNFYQSNMSYFAGAAAAQLFSIVIILYLFYGWWSLGWRSGSVSFSPLEMAKVSGLCYLPLIVEYYVI